MSLDIRYRWRGKFVSRSETSAVPESIRVRGCWKPSKSSLRCGTHSFPTITHLHPDRISILRVRSTGTLGFNGTYPFPPAEIPKIPVHPLHPQSPRIPP